MPSIDWKSLLQVAIDRIIPIFLTALATYFSTKSAAAAEVINRLMAGDTVPLYGGILVLSIANIKYVAFTAAVTIGTILIGWFRRVKLKRETNIALELPKNATKTDVKSVSEDSPSLSAQPDPAALRRVQNNLSGR